MTQEIGFKLKSPQNGTTRHTHAVEDRVQTEICNQVLVALGANMAGQKDSPIGQLRAAMEAIDEAGLTVRRKSRLFKTPCFPPGSGPDFVNAVVLCESNLAPEMILQTLHAIENKSGRKRVKRWEARILDLDLLAVGDLVLPDTQAFEQWAGIALEEQMTNAPDELILPHPRLQERAFVLVPLMDIVPDWRHPVLGLSVTEMVARLDPSELCDIVPVSQ